VAWPKPRCPFGIQGDILYVRETCRAEELPNGIDGIRYKADNAFLEIENTRKAGERWTKMYNYREGQGLWIPSIHMPKKATRLRLVNEETGIGWLQDITPEDILAEGITRLPRLDSFSAWSSMDRLEKTYGKDWAYERSDPELCVRLYGQFMTLWNSIHADPRPVRIKGVVDHYVSYPWDDVQKISEHRGKPWFIVGNPFVWKLKYRVRGRYEQTV